MALYARNDTNGGISITEISDQQIAQWQTSNNPKLSLYKLLVVDPSPVVGKNELLQIGGYIDEGNTTRQTWSVVPKPAELIEVEELMAEKVQLDKHLTDIKAQLDITNAARGALTNAQRLNELEKDTRVLMRSVKYLLRQAKRGF